MNWYLIKIYIITTFEYFVDLVWFLIYYLHCLGCVCENFLRLTTGFGSIFCIFYSLMPVTCPFRFGSWHFQIYYDFFFFYFFYFHISSKCYYLFNIQIIILLFNIFYIIRKRKFCSCFYYPCRISILCLLVLQN